MAMMMDFGSEEWWRYEELMSRPDAARAFLKRGEKYCHTYKDKYVALAPDGRVMCWSESIWKWTETNAGQLNKGWALVLVDKDLLKDAYSDSVSRA